MILIRLSEMCSRQTWGYDCLIVMLVLMVIAIPTIGITGYVLPGVFYPDYHECRLISVHDCGVNQDLSKATVEFKYQTKDAITTAYLPYLKADCDFCCEDLSTYRQYWCEVDQNDPSKLESFSWTDAKTDWGLSFGFGGVFGIMFLIMLIRCTWEFRKDRLKEIRNANEVELRRRRRV